MDWVIFLEAGCRVYSVSFRNNFQFFISGKVMLSPSSKTLIGLAPNSILCRVSLVSTPLLPSPLSPNFHELNCLWPFLITKKLHFISLRIAVVSRPSAMFEIATLARKYVGSAARSINNFSFCPQ